MKKFFMLLAVAGFFSMTTISCGEEATKDEDTTEKPADEHEHADGEEHGDH